MSYAHIMANRGCKVYRPETSNIECSNIGVDCVLHSHLWIGKGVSIGSRVKIQAFAYIPDGVSIHNDVFIGPRVTFTNDKYPPSHGEHWRTTIVKEGASIGAGAIILPGITIGKNARIGAGSVVTKDVPDGETWLGNPARKLTSKK